MKVKFKVFAFLVFASISNLFGQLPAARTINWANRGVIGGIPTFTATINFLNRGGIANNTAYDNSDSLQALVNSVAGTNTLIYFPAGIYRFKQKITVPLAGKLIIKGAGSNATFFQFETGSTGTGNFEMWGSQTAGPFDVTGGCTKNSTQLTLTSTSGLLLNDWIDISQENDSTVMSTTNPSNSLSLAPRSVGQIMKIIAISGNTITLDRELHFTYSLNLTVQVNKISMLKRVGFEDFSIECLLNGDKSNFTLVYAVNCWFKCIRSIKSVSTHINPSYSANITIRDSYFHDAWNFGNGGYAYGVALSTHTTDCLIENNVFDKLRHAMLVQRGANGNVFGYNYSINATTSGSISTYHRPPDISIHGYFPHMNLYEGNVVQSIYSADYWGPSGNGNTFFRNRATHGWIKMDDHSIEQNVLGNEINGTNSVFYTESALVNNTNCINTILHGNNDHGSIVWDNSLGANNLISSCYLSSAPAFFNGNAWPNIGPEFTLGSGSVPAQLRFAQAYDTECEIPFTTNISQNTLNAGFKIYPVPASNELTVEYYSQNNTTLKLKLINIVGEPVFESDLGTIASGLSNFTIDLNKIPTGIYNLVVIDDKRFGALQKVVVMH